MKNFKEKLGVAAAALILSAGGVAVSAAPAQAIASTTYDCFPASNTHTADNDYGCWHSPSGVLDNYVSSDGGAEAHGSIAWHNSDSSIEIFAQTHDLKSDGKGVHVQVEYYNGSSRTFSTIDGPAGPSGPGLYFSAGSSLSGSDEISIRVCNGTSNGSPINCGSWHGPFHNY